MIYLDHHAAAPTPERVRRAMQAAASTAWANPSSTHAAGRASRQLLEEAREQVASAIGAAAADLVLTGGGTEACNLGIRGLALGLDLDQVVTSEIEHPAVAESVRWLRDEKGRQTRSLSVAGGRPPSAEDLVHRLRRGTLVAVQWVNHETGTVFPIHEYALACRETGAFLFVDATQALGKIPIDVAALEADAVAIAAQKIGGPAGAGACWLRRGVDIAPLLVGGAQERGRRPGTPDTLNMVGFGAACTLIKARLADQPRATALRDRIEAGLVEAGGVVNGIGARVGTVSNMSFQGWEAPILVAALDLEGVCVSTGAACSSGLQEPSGVIRAMYPDEQWRAGSAVRISLGIETRSADLDTALGAFHRVLERREPSNFKSI